MAISLKALYDQVQGLSGRPKIDLLWKGKMVNQDILLTKSTKDYDFIIVLGDNNGGALPLYRIIPTKLPLDMDVPQRKKFLIWDRDHLTMSCNFSEDGKKIIFINNHNGASMIESIYGLSFNCLYNI